jgi:hypothetical protein
VCTSGSEPKFPDGFEIGDFPYAARQTNCLVTADQGEFFAKTNKSPGTWSAGEIDLSLGDNRKSIAAAIPSRCDSLWNSFDSIEFRTRQVSTESLTDAATIGFATSGSISRCWREPGAAVNETGSSILSRPKEHAAHAGRAVGCGFCANFADYGTGIGE